MNVWTVRQKNGRCRELEVAVCGGSIARNGLKGLSRKCDTSFHGLVQSWRTLGRASEPTTEVADSAV